MLRQERRVLERMRQLINNGWTQRAYAENEQGGTVSALDARAIRFCMLGAALRAQYELEDYMTYGRLATILFRDWDFDILCWNDAGERTKEEILAKLDHALDANV